MFYTLFLWIMDWLTKVVGYKTAIQIKDLGDAFIILVLGVYAKEWFIDSLFYQEVDLDPLQDPKIVILKVEDSPRKYMINPQSRYNLVATKFAWLIVRITNQKKLSHKNFNGIRLVSWIVVIILLFMAALFSAYEYLPR